jgi:hypothetical protein
MGMGMGMGMEMGALVAAGAALRTRETPPHTPAAGSGCLGHHAHANVVVAPGLRVVVASCSVDDRARFRQPGKALPSGMGRGSARGAAGCLLLASAALSMAACFDSADDCNDTLTCTPPPAPIVIVVEAPPCNGQCMPMGYSFWTDPFLVSMGTAPLPCADPAPADFFSGTALLASISCDACTCQAPAGSCELPATATTSASSCTGMGSGTPLDLPSPWDGSCAAQSVSAGASQSLTVAPLASSDACVPSGGGIQTGTSLPVLAQGCTGAAQGICPGDADKCIPAPAGPWMVCIALAGTADACPKGSPYTDLYSLWAGATDERACSPCTCGASEGSSCSSVFTAYADGACSAEVASVTASTSASACTGVLAGSSIGSVAASPPLYQPGTCPAGGGQVVGSVSYGMPETLCCLPAPASQP